MRNSILFLVLSIVFVGCITNESSNNSKKTTVDSSYNPETTMIDSSYNPKKTTVDSYYNSETTTIDSSYNPEKTTVDSYYNSETTTIDSSYNPEKTTVDSSQKSEKNYFAPELADLQGTWIGECQKYDNNSLRNIMDFSGSSIIQNIRIYVDAECKDIEFSQTTNMNLKIGTKEFIDKNNIPYKFIDMSYKTGEITFFSENDQMIAFNSNKLCGGGFEIGKAKEITNCEIFQEMVFYDLISLEGNLLFYGDAETGDAETEETRPDLVDIKEYMTKQ
jgi:hypothetical protein